MKQISDEQQETSEAFALSVCVFEFVSAKAGSEANGGKSDMKKRAR